MPLTKTESKKLRSLRTKKGRRLHGKFLAEGVRLLEESVRHRFFPEVVYFAPSLLTERGKRLVARLKALNIPLMQIPSPRLETISDARTSQGLTAVFALPETGLAKLYTPQYRNVLLCESIADPGNLGTLLRSALAFGFDMMLTCGSTADPYSPKVVRSSAGTVFGMKIARVSHAELRSFVGSEEVSLLAAHLKGELWSEQCDRTKQLKRRMLALGSEAEGLSNDILDLAAFRLRIDHSHRVESLNVSVAGSILMMNMYESDRK